MSTRPVLELARIVRDPTWLCMGYQPSGSLLHFRHVAVDDIERVVFLEPAKLPGHATCSARLDDVCSAMEPAGPGEADGLVIHTAFVCSTLLARCLQSPQRGLTVLRELPVWSGLALAREQLLLRNASDEWRRLTRVVGGLTSRPFEPGGRTLNKPSNSVLPVVAELLQTSAARAVLIHGTLPEFLVSCLKKASNGKAPWIAMRNALDPAGRTESVRRCVEPGDDPLRWACSVWHLQMELLAGTASSAVSGRIRQLSSQEFLAEPHRATAEAQAWLCPQWGREVDAARIAQESLGHAKRPGIRYDARRRLLESELAHRHFESMLRGVLQWSNGTFPPWQDALRSGALAFDALLA